MSEKIICFTLQYPAPNVTAQIIDINDYTEDRERFLAVLKPEYIFNKIHILPVKSVKAVLFYFDRNGIEEKAKLAKVLDEYYSKKGIPFYCVSWYSIYLSAVLLATIDEFGETVLENFSFMACFVSFEQEDLGYLNVCKEKDEYCVVTSLSIPYSDKMPLRHINAENIVFSRLSNVPDSPGQNAIEKKVKDTLFSIKPRKFFNIKKNVHDFLNKALVKKAQKLFASKPSNVDVAVIGFRDYLLAAPDQSNKIENIFGQNPVDVLAKNLLNIDLIERPPFKKSIVCYEQFKDLTLFHSLPECGNLLFKKVQKFPKATIVTTVTLSVDKYFIPSVEYQNSNNNNIKHGIIITFIDNKFTVELIKNGNLEKLDLNDIPLMIGFYDEKIQIGKEAAEIKEKHNSFVISDILKFMADDLSNLKIDPNWGFKVTKNAEDKILLEFDTFRGRRKTPPSFLISLILKWAIKNVELKTGLTELKPIILYYKFLDDASHMELFQACKSAKLPEKDFQIQRYKIATIKV